MHKKKILVLMKRFGSNKDMVKENFGREIRLLEPLAKKYTIDFLCPDYHLREKFKIKKNGINYFVVPVSFLNPFPMINSINRLMSKNDYDVIIPTTEPLLGIVGYYFSRKYKISMVHEVQDNYEMYDSYKIPFVKYLEHKVIKKSDYIFYSNYPLMKKLRFLRKDKFEIIENGVDLKLFRRVQKKTARTTLKIKQNIKLVTYTGHISEDRGINNLIEAVRQLREKDKTIYLLLSGKADEGFNIKHSFIIYEELPKREQLVMALNASDVLIIASSDNPFTRYCFPQKLFEYMAVNVPIVATAVGDVIRILKPSRDSLCMPGSIDDLKAKIAVQLKKKNISHRKVAEHYTWEKLSKKVDKMVIHVTKFRLH